MPAQPDMLRIMIAVPSQDTWKASFGQCILACVIHTNNELEAEISFVQERGTILNDMRTHLAEHAVASGATHIMCFDNDMTFPPDTILRLLAHKKPMVAANYPQRRKPVYSTVKSVDNKHYVYTDHMSTGLQEVLAAGFGCVLIETGVFTALSRPWFDGGEVRKKYDDGKLGAFGEDYFFFYKARQELGIPLHIDHDLSKMVGHIGEKVYDFEDALADRVEAKLVKSKVFAPPGDVMPHDKFSDIADLHAKQDPDELARITKEYRDAQREEEAEMEAALLDEFHARKAEAEAA